MRLKKEVNIGSKLNAFSTRQRQEPIIIKDRIQTLNPLRVDVAITDNPRSHLYKIMKYSDMHPEHGC